MQGVNSAIREPEQIVRALSRPEPAIARVITQATRVFPHRLSDGEAQVDAGGFRFAWLPFRDVDHRVAESIHSDRDGVSIAVPANSPRSAFCILYSLDRHAV